MAFMLQARWHITKGRIDEFRANQEIICAAMSGHPGVITYHVDYPEPDVSEWIEIYANDEVFRAHLENAAGKAPLAACRGLRPHRLPLLRQSGQGVPCDPRGVRDDRPRHCAAILRSESAGGRAFARLSAAPGEAPSLTRNAIAITATSGNPSASCWARTETGSGEITDGIHA
jgi:quinol monooxygenase YgiN